MSLTLVASWLHWIEQEEADLPRFRYCFYLDFLASQLDEPARNALLQLEEQAQYVRVLGSFPTRYARSPSPTLISMPSDAGECLQEPA
jgi:hypothetical protein